MNQNFVGHGVFRGTFSSKGNEVVMISSFSALDVWTTKTSSMIMSLDLLAMFLPLQPRVQLVLAEQAHVFLLFNLFTRIPRFFPAKLLSSPSLFCCVGLSMSEAGLCL